MRIKTMAISTLILWLCTILSASIYAFSSQGNLLLLLLTLVCSLIVTLLYVSERKKA